MTKTANDFNCHSKLLKATDEINKEQRQIFINKILKKYENNLSGKTFGIWGLAFKPETNDIREAPAITIINALLNIGANIQAYDGRNQYSPSILEKNGFEYICEGRQTNIKSKV